MWQTREKEREEKGRKSTPSIAATKKQDAIDNRNCKQFIDHNLSVYYEYWPRCLFCRTGLTGFCSFKSINDTTFVPKYQNKWTRNDWLNAGNGIYFILVRF